MNRSTSSFLTATFTQTVILAISQLTLVRQHALNLISIYRTIHESNNICKQVLPKADSTLHESCYCHAATPKIPCIVLMIELTMEVLTKNLLLQIA